MDDVSFVTGQHVPSGPTAVQSITYGPAVLFMLITSITLVGVPAFAWFYGYTLLDWGMFALLYAITGLGVTVGYHRLLAHRSFICPRWVGVALLIAGGWALQNSALVWASKHLRHHARCDEPEDPYNAQRGFWYSHCGWIFLSDPYGDQRYSGHLRQDSTVMWQHRYYVAIVLSGLALPLVVGYAVNGWLGAASCFLLAGVGRTFFVLNSTFCINSICHLWGTQPHGPVDSSRNSLVVSLFTFGEGYHNTHHAYPSDYRNGAHWYNFDPSKWLIFSLSALGLATGLRRSTNTRHRIVALE
jgi:stearoyl-CoA desaturase (delta-9 desaturase)